MHCFAFIARYLDVFTYPSVPDNYLSYSKLYNLIGAASIILVLLRAHGSFSAHETRSTIYQVFVTFFVCLVLGSVFNYSQSLVEIAWSFSIFMASVADVPQLVEYDRMEQKDGWLTAYLVLCFAFRALHLPHWILRCV